MGLVGETGIRRIIAEDHIGKRDSKRKTEQEGRRLNLKGEAEIKKEFFENKYTGAKKK